eukprot:869023-Alexandrium_andersonii.AAC.1
MRGCGCNGPAGSPPRDAPMAGEGVRCRMLPAPSDGCACKMSVPFGAEPKRMRSTSVRSWLQRLHAPRSRKFSVQQRPHSHSSRRARKP